MLSPLPVGAAVEFFRELAYFTLFARIPIKVLGRRLRARDQERCVNRRDFRLPGAMARLHIQEVIVEAFASNHIRTFAVRAVIKELQLRQRSLDRFGPR